MSVAPITGRGPAAGCTNIDETNSYRNNVPTRPALELLGRKWRIQPLQEVPSQRTLPQPALAAPAGAAEGLRHTTLADGLMQYLGIVPEKRDTRAELRVQHFRHRAPYYTHPPRLVGHNDPSYPDREAALRGDPWEVHAQQPVCILQCHAAHVVDDTETRQSELGDQARMDEKPTHNLFKHILRCLRKLSELDQQYTRAVCVPCRWRQHHHEVLHVQGPHALDVAGPRQQAPGLGGLGVAHEGEEHLDGLRSDLLVARKLLERPPAVLRIAAAAARCQWRPPKLAPRVGEANEGQ
mmetsp:Transcript_7413/g.18715  ORF Transcript_7413/g.18715 Transcript_7413/m.18715 type:complete len:295 (+) Transcript_7413:27-911(+)